MILEWIKSLFSKKETTVIKHRIKRPYRGNTTIEEYTMPMQVEEPDQINSMNLMIDDGSGNVVPASQQQLQGFMHRPDNYTGLFPNQRNQQTRNQPPMQQYQPPYNNQPQPNFAPPNAPNGYPPQYAPQPQYAQTQTFQQPAPTQPPKKPYPAHEIYVLNNAYHIQVDLPGIDETSMNIEVIDSNLIISGHRDLSALKSRSIGDITDAVSTIPQFLVGDFSFSFSFKKMIDESNVSAEYNSGVLHVTLPHRIKGDKVTIGLKTK